MRSHTDSALGTDSPKLNVTKNKGLVRIKRGVPPPWPRSSVKGLPKKEEKEAGIKKDGLPSDEKKEEIQTVALSSTQAAKLLTQLTFRFATGVLGLLVVSLYDLGRLLCLPLVVLLVPLVVLLADLWSFPLAFSRSICALIPITL